MDSSTKEHLVSSYGQSHGNPGSNPGRSIETSTRRLPSTKDASSSIPGSMDKVQKIRVRALVRKLLQPDILRELSCHNLEDIITACSRERKKRYKQKDRKYGNINKGFTEEELIRFLNHCKNSKARLGFTISAKLGLRIGEVVKVNIRDIDVHHKQLSVQTEKARTGDILYLHDEIWPHIQEWMTIHRESIMCHDGFLLFADNRSSTRQHISPDWLRNEFRKTAAAAGLDTWYSKSEESIVDRTPRHLHRLTTHSLRHYYITRVYNGTNNLIVTQKLARHTDSKSTETYIFTAKQSLDQQQRMVFEKAPIAQEKEDEEVKKVVAILKAIR